MVFPDHTACTNPGNIVGGAGGGGPQVFSVINLRFFLKKTIIFQDSREGPTFSRGGGGGGGGQTLPGGGGGGGSIRIQITCDFPGVGSDPLSPSGSSHENSLFKCFAHD